MLLKDRLALGLDQEISHIASLLPLFDQFLTAHQTIEQHLEIFRTVMQAPIIFFALHSMSASRRLYAVKCLYWSVWMAPYER